MKAFLITLTSLIILSLVWCGNKEKRLYYGENNIPVVRQFHDAFTHTSSDISRFGGIGEELEWGSTAVYHQRYKVELYFPISAFGNRISQSGEARFRISEVESIEKFPGGYGIKYTGKSRSFTTADWERIRQNNLDFSLIDYPIIINKPINHIVEATAFPN